MAKVRVAVNEQPEQSECGCRLYEVSVSGTKHCHGGLRIVLRKRVKWWRWTTVRLITNYTAGGINVQEMFELCPEDGAGWYRVRVKCANWWFWRKSPKFWFEPAKYCVELSTSLIDTKGRVESNYDTGSWPCDSPIHLRVDHHACWKRYFIRLQRVVDGNEVGPTVSTSWALAPPPTLQWNLRLLANSLGMDLVPGQCYKVDVFAQTLICGSKWSSVGKLFCIDC